MALEFAQVIVTEIPKRTTSPGTASIDVPAGKIWKIESAGIGGTNGALYLKTGVNLVAILFTTINRDLYTSQLPFWLPPDFSGELVNDSGERAIVSITEWNA